MTSNLVISFHSGGAVFQICTSQDRIFSISVFDGQHGSLKATFPFRFTSADGNNLFSLIEMALGIYDPADEKKQETKKERRRMKLGRVLDSY